MYKKWIITSLSLLLMSHPTVPAQDLSKDITLSGSIQSDILFPQKDDEIGATTGNDWAVTNTYAEVYLHSPYIEAGTRFEYLKHPLPGYEKDLKGWGVPYAYIKGHYKDFELTIGSIYEQFGSGFILRTYEERSLGIDNSLMGGRLVVKPLKGTTIKILSGRQRRYWNWNKAWVSGADMEMNIDEWSPSMQKTNTTLTIGASWVNKNEKDSPDIFADATHKVNIPQYVNAWDFRVNFHHGEWNLLAEYAQKTEDPSYANGYIFRSGSVAMLSTSYSKKGLSLLLQAKRSENMSFRSTNETSHSIGISSYVNHLPAFTKDHTYALETLYPYATQIADGEWAYQAEAGYKFKRNTLLGGKYGMNLNANFSHVHSIQRDFQNGTSYRTLAGIMDIAGTEGYSSPFFKWGNQTFYQDFDIQISKKMSPSFSLLLTYMNQQYNQTLAEGHGGMIHSNIFIADCKYKITSKTILRSELQYLTTADDQGDWAFGLLELSLAPHWMFTISDMYNAGNTHLHYYQGFITLNRGSHRLQVGYGRTRAGYNCAGGICRYVPANKGINLSYHYSF